MRLVCPVARAASAGPGAPALEFERCRWTWAEVDGLVGAWAAWLAQRGVQRGQRVGLCAENRPEAVFLLHACARLGATLVPFNTRATRSELRALIAAAEPRLMLRGPQRHAEGEPLPTLEPRASERVVVLEEAAVVAALFTSGTTAAPKLVPVTQANLWASAAASAANLGGHPGQRWLGTLPLFHVGGLAMAHRCAVYGASLALEPGFDVGRVNAWLASGRVTHASLVPTTLRRLLGALDRRPYSSCVEAVLVGGGPMSAALLNAAREAGLPVLQTYGLTEACSQVTTERPGEADGLTAGHPLPGVEVRVLDEAGCVCAVDEVGEIHVRGATVVGPREAWLRTADLGQLDARGRLRVWSRRVDLIVSGGENIAPAELEHALGEHPDVAELAVVPRVDAEWGQVPIACVVARPGFDAERFLSWARDRVASFKLPKAVLVVPSLPRNSSGKLRRDALRSWVEREHAHAQAHQSPHPAPELSAMEGPDESTNNGEPLSGPPARALQPVAEFLRGEGSTVLSAAHGAAHTGSLDSDCGGPAAGRGIRHD